MSLNDQVNDAQMTALQKAGFTGQLNQLVSQWLKSEGAVGNDMPELWRTFFNVKAVPQGQHNDRMQKWLNLEGFNRITLSDSQHAYWKNRALS